MTNTLRHLNFVSAIVWFISSWIVLPLIPFWYKLNCPPNSVRYFLIWIFHQAISPMYSPVRLLACCDSTDTLITNSPLLLICTLLIFASTFTCYVPPLLSSPYCLHFIFVVTGYGWITLHLYCIFHGPQCILFGCRMTPDISSSSYASDRLQARKISQYESRLRMT